MGPAVSRRAGVVAVAVIAALALGACTSKHTASAPKVPTQPSTTTSTSSAATPAPSSSTPPPPAPAAKLTISPRTGSAGISPAVNSVAVGVADGTLSGVTMTNQEGKVVTGALSADKTSWKLGEELGYGKTYTIKASATNADGKPVTEVSKFTTLTPNNQTMPSIETTGGNALQNGATYGVGLVVNVHFDESITDKKAAEAALKVTTTPAVKGAWYWLDDSNAHWRPATYYAAGTKVTVAADVYGKDLGGGLYGQADTSLSFSIGRRQVTVADDNTKMVNVYNAANKVIRTMPTSMGQGGYVQGTNGPISLWTMPGTYTVLEHDSSVIMSSASYGLPANSPKGYAPETIYWATKISTDGIYLHQLDSTVWAQGNTDTSHGCLNLNQTNATWFFQNSLIGDPVEIKHTGGPAIQVWQNGDWSVPWATWVKGGAIS